MVQKETPTAPKNLIPLLPARDLGVIQRSPAPLSNTLFPIPLTVDPPRDEPRQRVMLLLLSSLPTILIRPPTKVTSGETITVALLTTKDGSRQYKSPLLLAGTNINALPFLTRPSTTDLRLFPNELKLKQRPNRLARPIRLATLNPNPTRSHTAHRN